MQYGNHSDVIKRDVDNMNFYETNDLDLEQLCSIASGSNADILRQRII